MAIRLITSESYLDNIRNYLPEKANSKSSVLEKSNKVFNNIINSPNFTFDKNDVRITDLIKKLISIRPGRTLFKRLLKANQPLKIVLDSLKEPACVYDSQTKAATITLNDYDSKVTLFDCVNPNGEKFFISTCDESITLAHELVHALHYFEEGLEFVKQKKSGNIIDPKLSNLEEQETILGKEGEGTLCENVFRFHFGHPLRINHQIILLNKEETLTASTCAFNGALVNLKSMLKEDPSFLNRSQQCTGTIYRKMTPLSASIIADEIEIFNALLQEGADVNARDECWGTALHAAIKTKQLVMVNLLLQKGADVTIRDPIFGTAFEFALKLNNGSAELLAPFNPSFFSRAISWVGSLVYSYPM